MDQSIETPRLNIRRLVADDAQAVAGYQLANRQFHGPWSPLRDDPWFDVSATRDRLAPKPDLWPIGFWYEHELVGIVTLSQIAGGAFCAAYLGFSVDQHRQGQGLMTEGLRALFPAVFATAIEDGQNLHRLMAAHMPANHRSAALLKSLGFAREGMAPAYLRIAGDWEDHVLTALINPAHSCS